MIPNYITVQQFVERHSWPPIGGLRHLLRQRKSNGLEDCGAVTLVGRRVLINEIKFFNWMERRKDERA